MIISHILKHNENRRQSECMKLKVPSWVQNIRWYARYFLELDSRWYQTLLFPSRPLQNCWPPSSQCEPSQPRIVLILTISITGSMWSCRLVAVNYPNSVISCFFCWMCRSMKIRSEILQQLQNISLNGCNDDLMMMMMILILWYRGQASSQWQRMRWLLIWTSLLRLDILKS